MALCMAKSNKSANSVLFGYSRVATPHHSTSLSSQWKCLVERSTDLTLPLEKRRLDLRTRPSVLRLQHITKETQLYSINLFLLMRFTTQQQMSRRFHRGGQGVSEAFHSDKGCNTLIGIVQFVCVVFQMTEAKNFQCVIRSRYLRYKSSVLLTNAHTSCSILYHYTWSRGRAVSSSLVASERNDLGNIPYQFNAPRKAQASSYCPIFPHAIAIILPESYSIL